MARYPAIELLNFTTALFEKAGLATDRAGVVAEVLLEGDLMGHSTHGLQLADRHLSGIRSGAIAREGDPIVVSDHGAAVTWDAGYLPGPWLVRKAMDESFRRAATMPVVTFCLRKAGHIACLGAYPRLAAERNLIMLLTSSDPAVAIVAPSGAVEGCYTPNPIAAGWPTDGAPIIVDTCPSTTTGGMVGRIAAAGGKLPGEWLVDANGHATDDASLLAAGKGAILPLGGLELGHKGFALALIVEMLTSALAGFGRADGVRQDGASVFLQVINPNLFGGLDRFCKETAWLARSCEGAKTSPGGLGVRMPGARGLAMRKDQLQNGVALHETTIAVLTKWANEFRIAFPATIGD